MTTMQMLNERETALLSGGGTDELRNPSEVYCGDNYGQAKKLGFDFPNPSEIYCGDNYGQAKKAVG